MTLINLSEKYMTEAGPRLHERVMMFFELEWYYASSLSALDDFITSPPRKKEFISGKPSAYVIMHDIGMKRFDADLFDDDDERALRDMDGCRRFPLMHLRDGTKDRLAYWMAGRSQEYLAAKELFGFRSDGFIAVPKVYILLRQFDDYGMLALKRLDDGRPARPSKTLRERLIDLIPPEKVPVAQPA